MFLAEEGFIVSEFYAPRRLSRLSPAGRQMAELFSEAEKIAASLKPSLIRKVNAKQNLNGDLNLIPALFSPF